MARMGAKHCERCSAVIENPRSNQKRHTSCQEEYRAERGKRRAEAGEFRRRYAANREDLRAKAREAMRADYARNPEKRKARVQAWREANPEKARESAAKWRAANPDLVEAGRAAYRARREGAPEDGTRPTWQKVAARDGFECHLCGGETDPSDRVRFTRADGVESSKAGPTHPSLDHVTPLSRGGEHSMANARIAHMRCNSSKGARNG